MRKNKIRILHVAWIATSECFSSIWTKKSSRIYWFAHMISMKKTSGRYYCDWCCMFSTLV